MLSHHRPNRVLDCITKGLTPAHGVHGSRFVVGVEVPCQHGPCTPPNQEGAHVLSSPRLAPSEERPILFRFTLHQPHSAIMLAWVACGRLTCYWEPDLVRLAYVQEAVARCFLFPSIRRVFQLVDFAVRPFQQ